MRSSFTRVVLPAALVAGFAVAPAFLGAQPGGVAPACPADATTPKELALLELQVQKAQAASTPEIRQSALRAIVKELDTKPERFAKNPGGYNKRLAQALFLWAMEPGIANSVPRAQVGFITDPTGQIDLVVQLDAAYKAIVAAHPTCAAEVSGMRQNELWLAITRRALDASNSGQGDTADFYAKRSLMMSTDSPYPYYVLGNTANQRKDRATAIANWKLVITQAGDDTTHRQLKNSSLYLLAVNQLDAAEAATGAEKQAMARESAGNFKALLMATPDNPDAPNIMTSWSDALKVAGDSAAIPGIYADMMAKPAGFSDMALTMGAVIATRVNKTDDAIVLNSAAIAKNPNARDALRNLAANYYAKDEFVKMLGPSKTLVDIDPNNFDGWMMFAYAAQGMAKAPKALPAEKKAWTDTLVKYQTIAEALPVKVDVVSFQRGEKDVVLTLSFDQQAATDGSYAVVVEFLDAAGAVVGTASQSVGPIKKGEPPKSMAFKAAAAGIVGYRYKSLK